MENLKETQLAPLNDELQVVDPKTLTVSKTKIYVSYDYDRFTLSEFNRVPGFSKKLAESIKKNDLTQYDPILVDNRLVIIDGQHRFLVCMELGLPIHFIISNEVMINDAADINQASKNWSTLDYIMHYYKRGIESYVKLVDYSKIYKLHTTNLLSLGKGSVDKNQTVTDLTKSGKFKFKMSDEKIQELLRNFQIFREYYDFADTTIFFKAYIRVASLRDYSPKRMFEKLQEASGIVHRQPRQQLQIEELLKLYNYGSRKNRLKLDKQKKEDFIEDTDTEEPSEPVKKEEPKVKANIVLKAREEIKSSGKEKNHKVMEPAVKAPERKLRSRNKPRKKVIA